jgi:hypothetical protein
LTEIGLIWWIVFRVRTDIDAKQKAEAPAQAMPLVRAS